MTDELKPVRCGCGGEAEVFHVAPEGYAGSYCVRCVKCLTQSPFFTGNKEKAIETWNRAMGAGKNEVAITKGYWMVTYDGLHCSICNYKCETTAAPSVCPRCGMDMRGE